MSGTIAEAQNTVNVGNIDNFCNQAVGDFYLMDDSYDVFRGSLSDTVNIIDGDEFANLASPPLTELCFGASSARFTELIPLTLITFPSFQIMNQ